MGGRCATWALDVVVRLWTLVEAGISWAGLVDAGFFGGEVSYTGLGWVRHVGYWVLAGVVKGVNGLEVSWK